MQQRGGWTRKTAPPSPFRRPRSLTSIRTCNNGDFWSHSKLPNCTQFMKVSGFVTSNFLEIFGKWAWPVVGANTLSRPRCEPINFETGSLDHFGWQSDSTASVDNFRVHSKRNELTKQ